MTISKIRDRNHILGEKAIRFLGSNIFPEEWVIRDIYPDYGLDLDVELFDYENGKCITLGEHLYAG